MDSASSARASFSSAQERPPAPCVFGLNTFVFRVKSKRWWHFLFSLILFFVTVPFHRDTSEMALLEGQPASFFFKAMNNRRKLCFLQRVVWPSKYSCDFYFVLSLRFSFLRRKRPRVTTTRLMTCSANVVDSAVNDDIVHFSVDTMITNIWRSA